eukprot:351269-Chlamydomonas_euryale.AAC.5
MSGTCSRSDTSARARTDSTCVSGSRSLKTRTMPRAMPASTARSRALMSAEERPLACEEGEGVE